MSFNSKSVFQLNDKNITLEGLGHVKDAIDFVLQNVKSITVIEIIKNLIKKYVKKL